MLTIFKNGTTPVSGQAYDIHLVGQDLSTYETIYLFSGDYDEFYGLYSGNFEAVDDIPISGNIPGYESRSFSQRCIPGKYGNFLSFASIEEKMWEDIREKRNEVLKNSDFMFLTDKEFDVDNDFKKLYKAYRKQLRDLPQDHGTPFSVKITKEPN